MPTLYYWDIAIRWSFQAQTEIDSRGNRLTYYPLLFGEGATNSDEAVDPLTMSEMGNSLHFHVIDISDDRGTATRTLANFSLGFRQLEASSGQPEGPISAGALSLASPNPATPFRTKSAPFGLEDCPHWVVNRDATAGTSENFDLIHPGYFAFVASVEVSWQGKTRLYKSDPEMIIREGG